MHLDITKSDARVIMEGLAFAFRECQGDFTYQQEVALIRKLYAFWPEIVKEYPYITSVKEILDENCSQAGSRD